MKTNHKPMKNNTPVAIIGMACFFPKSSGLKEYWRLIFRGEDAISEIPESHWSPEDYFDEDPKKPDHVYCKRGGFLSPVSFDPSEFGIPPSSLEATDTSQLFGLLTAKMALEDAGYGESRKDFTRDRISVILGATGTQELVIPLGARLGHPLWRKALEDSGIPPEKTQEVVERISDAYVSWQENSFPGLLGNVISGRICNRLDLGGTNCAADAACASSMSSVHIALMELISGRSEMVITGGVDTLNDIFMHMCFSRTQILSATGDARPFSKDADGTVLGEGIGMVVLKRLEDAERDGDKIYAVIKGLGTSSDGKSQSIYAPRAEGQARALRTAYEDAGIPIDSVELVEAHGTGTRVGDAVEFQALKQVFGEAETEHPKSRIRCAIGSVKSMIGHTKAAAGAAGLIKAVLSLYHKVLPPTLKITEPDPNLAVDESPFYLSTEARPWFPREDHPRRAGVSSFGFGGSNFHVVLEEYRKEKQEIAWDGSVPKPEQIKPEQTKPGKIAFIFPGQGSQYVNMGRDLICTFPEAFEILEKANGAGGRLQVAGCRAQGTGKFEENRLSDFIYPYPAMTKADKALQEEQLRSTDVAQPAIGAVSVAMLKILERFGIKPDAVCGHSYGELSALYAAGWIDLETFFRLSFARGAFMAAAAGQNAGSMLAVKAPLETLDAMIKAEHLDVILANRNSPAQGVLSGSAEAIAHAEKICKQNKLRGIKLPVSAAFHSSLVKDAQEPFMELLKTAADICPSDIPVFANTTGDAYPLDPDMAKKLLGEQILCPVNFVGEIEKMFESGVRTFVEVGPKSVLTGLVKAILRGREFNALSLDSSGGKNFGVADLANFLSQLAAMGYPVDWDQWDRPAEPKKQRMSIMISGANYRSESKPQKPKSANGSDGSGNSNNSGGTTPPVSKPEFGNGGKESCSKQAAPGCCQKSAGVEKKISPVPKPDFRNGRETSNHKKEAGMRMSVPETFITENRTAMDKNQEKYISAPQQHLSPPRTHARNCVVTDALKAVQEGLKSMQTLQMHTADTHKKFLETQTEASRTLQMMMESTRRLAEVSMGVTPRSHAFVPRPVYSQTPTWQRQEEAPAWKGGEQYETPAWEQNTSSSASDAQPSPSVPTYSPEIPVEAPKIEPAPVSVSEPARTDHPNISNALLEVVSQLTGYPTEMLNTDMDIEADLGIDSIKRVEILSALEEKMPGLPQVSPEIMGTLKTLGQIVGYLDGNGSQSAKPELCGQVRSQAGAWEREGNGSQSAKPELCGQVRSQAGAWEREENGSQSAKPELCGQVRSQAGAWEREEERHSPGANTGEIETTLLDVVSQLTGYPSEMLGLEMDIEADLGIDSIKRVEILSALEERMPGLPQVSPEIMGTLKSLGQIVEYLGRNGSQPAKQELCGQVRSQAGAWEREEGRYSPGGIRGEIEITLLDVVSQLTGYPSEMLGLEMDIEADLGIDSIKRVEILSALEERMPGLPQVSPEIMGTLKTLGQIVEYLAGNSQSHAGNPMPEIRPTLDRTPDIERKIISLVEKPAEYGNPVSVPKGRKILITDDGTGLANAIAEALGTFDMEAVLISPDEQHLPAAGGLVILSNSDADFDSQVSSLKQAFLLARRAGKDILDAAKEQGAVFAAITRLDGAFGFSGRQIENPLQGGLAGLVKTASIEWEGVCCHAIDISPDWKDTQAIAKAVAAELVHAGPPEIGLAEGKRLIPELEPSPYPQGEINLFPGDVVVVTGGARGVTAASAYALAVHTKPTLILLGRSPHPAPEPSWLNGLRDEPAIKKAILENEFTGKRPSPVELEKAFKTHMANREISENLERLKQTGSTVAYYSADVRDFHGVNSIFEEVRSTYGTIKGIIHGAGTLEDRLIIDKTPEQFEKVFDTKVRGLNVLLDATTQDDLSYLVFFSSVSARMGNKGQADYAMANEVLNKIAQQEALIRPNCRVISVNWGPWDGGMVSPSLKREFERNGIKLIPPDEGAMCLLCEMAGDKNDPAEVVIGASFKSQSDQTFEVSETSKVLSLSFKREIDVERYPILGAHILGGRPVVPFALIAEWLGHGALHENPGLFLHGLDNIRLLSGIKLNEEKKLIRLLAGKPRRNGELYEVDVEIRDGIHQGKEVIHSSAKAILTDRLSDPPAFTAAGEFGSKSYARTVDEIYEKILFHGLELRGIREILGYSSKGIAAKVSSAPSPEKWMTEPLRSRWIADPLVLDSAFQMAIIWCFEEKGLVSLPGYCESYRQYRNRFPDDGVTAILEVKETNAHKMKGDFTFLDSDNTVVARMTGYEAIMDASLFEAFKS